MVAEPATSGGGAGDLRQVGPRGATPIGEVIDDGVFRVTHDGLTVVAIPGQRLVDDVPVYHPEAREARGRDCPRGRRRRRARRRPPSIEGTLRALLLDRPTIASKRWVYEQYDSTVQASHRVRARRRRRRGRRCPAPTSALAVTVDCNGRLVALDPVRGRQGRGCRGGAQRRLHRRACRWASPTASTSATRRSPRSSSSSARPSRHGRGVPRVRHAGHRRQRLVLQRESHRARSTRRRRSAWSACSSRSISRVQQLLPQHGRRDRAPG